MFFASKYIVLYLYLDGIRYEYLTLLKKRHVCYLILILFSSYARIYNRASLGWYTQIKVMPDYSKAGRVLCNCKSSRGVNSNAD